MTLESITRSVYVLIITKCIRTNFVYYSTLLQGMQQLQALITETIGLVMMREKLLSLAGW